MALPRERSVWASFSPDPNLILGLPGDTTFVEPSGLEQWRQHALAPNLSIAYDESHSSRARRRRLPLRLAGTGVPGLRQQRRARRSRAPLCRAGRPASNGRVEYEHAIPARCDPGVRRAALSTVPGPVVSLLSGELRERSKRARTTSGTGAHRRRGGGVARGRIPWQYPSVHRRKPLQVRRTGWRWSTPLGRGSSDAGSVPRHVPLQRPRTSEPIRSACRRGL